MFAEYHLTELVNCEQSAETKLQKMFTFQHLQFDGNGPFHSKYQNILIDRSYGPVKMTKSSLLSC